MLRATDNASVLLQVFYELQSLHSMAFADPIGSLLDWRAGKATAAAATPAYMSGAVLWPDMVDTIVCQVSRYCAPHCMCLALLILINEEHHV